MENNSSDFHEEQKGSVLYGFTGALLSAVSRRAAGHQHIYYPPAVSGTLQLSRGNMKAPDTTDVLVQQLSQAKPSVLPGSKEHTANLQAIFLDLTGEAQWSLSIYILQNPEGMDTMQ